jgi:uncharacterized metal-binding protein
MSFIPRCAKCPSAYCTSAPMEKISKDTLPANCPMKISPETVINSGKRYKDDDVRRLYVPATITEKEAYQVVRGVRMAVRPRIKELVEFSKLLGIKKIGIAFCAGLRDEALRLTTILEEQGFEVASVLCKCGGADKTKLGVAKQDKIGSPEKFEAGCNPLLQAELLNKAETEINVIVGLCIGHDILFTMNSKAPVTTLIVKDRLLGHNPVIGLYSAYHKGIIASQTRI